MMREFRQQHVGSRLGGMIHGKKFIEPFKRDTREHNSLSMRTGTTSECQSRGLGNKLISGRCLTGTSHDMAWNKVKEDLSNRHWPETWWTRMVFETNSPTATRLLCFPQSANSSDPRWYERLQRNRFLHLYEREVLNYSDATSLKGRS